MGKMDCYFLKISKITEPIYLSGLQIAIFDLLMQYFINNYEIKVNFRLLNQKLC